MMRFKIILSVFLGLSFFNSDCMKSESNANEVNDIVTAQSLKSKIIFWDKECMRIKACGIQGPEKICAIVTLRKSRAEFACKAAQEAKAAKIKAQRMVAHLLINQVAGFGQ